MKLLLTSGGIRNASIERALVELLDKPIAESDALFIPTAIYGLPFGPKGAYADVNGPHASAFTQLGWKSLGLLELTTLPTLKREMWTKWIEETDALLVGGGDPSYLVHWMRRSGLADLLPALGDDKVYVGLSAGSMVAGTDFGNQNYGGLNLPADADTSGLGLASFTMFPHLDYPGFAHNTSDHAEAWGAKQTIPAYAVDDDSALRVVGGEIDVVSEGKWKRFDP